MRHPLHLYHIFPLGALRKEKASEFSHNPSDFYNILKLTELIPHLQSMLIDTILLGPVFTSQNHGYEVIDQRRVDPRIGDWSDLRETVSAFHKVGIRVMLDAVWNHTSKAHRAYQDILRNGPESPFINWYQNLHNLRPGYDGWTFHTDCWNGHQELPKLHLGNPEVRREIHDIVTMWINELDIDGIRLDAADVMDRTFLRELYQYCRSLKKDFWAVAEVVHGDYRLWLEEADLSSVTHYEGYKSLWSSFNDGNFFEIAYSLNRLFDDEHGLYKAHRLLLFNENHDVSRVASILRDRRHLYPLHLLHYTIPGIPSLYYGEEWGFQAVKRPENDWNLRPPLPFVPPEHINEPELKKYLIHLAGLHKANPALVEGGYRQLHVAAKQFAFIRTHPQQNIIIAVNSDFRETEIEINIETSDSDFFDILNGGEKFTCVQQGRLKINIPPCWGRVFPLFH